MAACRSSGSSSPEATTVTAVPSRAAAPGTAAPDPPLLVHLKEVESLGKVSDDESAVRAPNCTRPLCPTRPTCIASASSDYSLRRGFVMTAQTTPNLFNSTIFSRKETSPNSPNAYASDSKYTGFLVRLAQPLQPHTLRDVGARWLFGAKALSCPGLAARVACRYRRTRTSASAGTRARPSSSSTLRSLCRSA